MPRLMLFALLALPLAGCNQPDEGTTISINADSGNVLGAVDGKSGEVKLDVPGFSGKIKLPKIQLDADNFDLNGVHLYPGSTIDNVNVAGGGKQDSGTVEVSFTSPANPAAVQQWFQDRLNKVGFTVNPGGNGLVGTTDEHKPFALDLSPDGQDRSKGKITLGS
ncbi:MAG: hypothetical protein M3R64_08730 [Pseudomonadota bacterium]|nr:hypothetical protein [Pseudomonadota bacterium]